MLFFNVTIVWHGDNKKVVVSFAVAVSVITYTSKLGNYIFWYKLVKTEYRNAGREQAKEKTEKTNREIERVRAKKTNLFLMEANAPVLYIYFSGDMSNIVELLVLLHLFSFSVYLLCLVCFRFVSLMYLLQRHFIPFRKGYKKGHKTLGYTPCRKGEKGNSTDIFFLCPCSFCGFSPGIKETGRK